MKIALIGLLSLIAQHVPTTVCADDEAPRYLKDGKLTAALTFKDVQGGFAGFTGRKYEVQPDGTWAVTRVFNQRKFKPERTGRLTAKQLKSLASVLADNRIHTLPARVGSRAQANPKVLTLRWGKKQHVCALPAGLEDPAKLKDARLAGVAKRMFAVRKALLSAIGPARKRR